jgi:hypothetical protein
MMCLNNRFLYVSLVLCALATGCGDDDPANVAGSYTIAVTNGDNGCEFGNWNEGDTAQNIGLEMTQQGSSLDGEVTGFVATTYLDVVLGAHVFSGDVDGTSLELGIVGTTPFRKDNCDYTIDATLTATIDGDVLVGTIDYSAKTDGSDDCGTLDACHSVQSFNGTRPPTN